MTNLQLSKHFNSSEFDCHGGDECGCGGRGDRMHPILIKLLEKWRDDAGGYPFHINSGYRCPIHNSHVEGSASYSQHMAWTAADVACPPELDIWEFAWYAEHTEVDGYRFDGIGVYTPDYGNFIHVDVRDGGRHGGWYRW